VQKQTNKTICLIKHML